MRVLVSGLILLLTVYTPVAAHATDRDLKAVINTSAYGMLAGTAVGLIAWPITGSERAVFVGASVGLYLGIAAGLYHISSRDDLGNPFRALLQEGEKPAPPKLFPKVAKKDELPPVPALVSISLLTF